MKYAKWAAVSDSSGELRMLRSIMKSARDAILVTEAEPVDQPGPRVVYVNESFTKMTGYEPQDIIGRTPRILQGSGSDRGTLDEIRSALEAWEPIRAELLNYRKDGREFWVELDIVPVSDEDGWFTHWVSVQRDITQRRKAQERLQISLTENSADIVAIFESDGRLRFVSESLERILGRKPEEIERRQPLFHVHPEDRSRVTDTFFGGGSRGYVTPLVAFRVRHSDGTWKDFEAVANNLVEDAAVGGVIVNAWDVTERKKTEDNLRLRDGAIAASSNGILITDATTPDNPVIYFNRALEEITGYSADEVLGRNARFLQGSDTRQSSLVGLREAVEEGRYWYGVLRNYRKDGTLFWNEMSVSPVHDDAGRLVNFIGIQNDVTRRKLLEERLEYQAFHDSLTGLPNRALLMDRLKQSVARSKRRGSPVAVLFVDLDNFKVVNDSLGHAAGNHLLAEAAERIMGCAGDGDTVARLSGDEFIVLTEDSGDLGSARRLAEDIRRSLGRPFEPDTGAEYVVTASIGIAPGGDAHFDRPGKLLEDADLAMYRAKEDGKDRFSVYEVSMSNRAVERLELEQGLREALRCGEFRLHYQPEVSVSDGEICALEALIRWERPGLGLAYPGDFIPVAEESGLIAEIGLWVIGEACRQMSLWNSLCRDEGRPELKVAVNLSAKQFRRPALVEEVQSVLDDTGLEAHDLVLEITETALMENAPGTVSTLTRLKETGVRLAIDDFGTGYSSLAYLKRFPVDCLKIDRSFIGDETITQASIFISHSMGIEVVAEGVETSSQYERLKEMGCDVVQGYYLHRPMIPEAAGEII